MRSPGTFATDASCTHGVRAWTKNKRPLIALGLIVCASLVLSACSQWGYVFADQSSASTYTPNANDSVKSSGAPTTITRAGAGTYTVHFTGLNSTGGVVHVTSRSTSDAICTVAMWGAVTGGVDATVKCFNADGVAADTTFAATFAAPQPASYPYAQLWANEPASTMAYHPDAAYSLNSTGAMNSVTHPGVGSYIVTLPGLGSGDLGNVKVTATATTAVVCFPTSLAPDGNGAMRIPVSCVNAAGTAVNAAFTLTWTTQNLLGVTRASAHIAFFTAGGVASTFNSTGGTNTVVENSAGKFTVTFGGLAGAGGNAQAQVLFGISGTAGPGNCTVATWSAIGANEVADVRCFDMTATPANPIILVVHYVR